jgi:iron complex outermembrane receptor protein
MRQTGRRRGAPPGLAAWLCAGWWVCGASGVQAQAAAPAPAPVPAPAPAAPAPSPAPAPAAPVTSITIEGSRLTEDDQRRDRVIGMTVVGRDELDAYGDSSILDVLQRVPGVTLDGDTPQLRGLGGGYTQILINGEPAPPGFSLDSLAPADIERIEVIKGPTAEFGGAAGTINVILRNAPRLRQRELRASLGYRAVAPQGSVSTSWSDRTGALGWHLPLSVSTWANAGHARTWRLSRTAAGDLTERVQTATDRWQGIGFNLGPRLDWTLGPEDSLQWQVFLQGNRSRHAGERQTDVLQGPPPSDLRDEVHSRGIWQLARSQWQWTHKPAAGGRFELKAAVEGSRSASVGRSQLADAAGLPTVRRDWDNSTRQQVLSQGGRWRLPWGQGHTLAAGWDLQQRQRDELRRWFDNGVEQLSGTLGVPFTAEVRRGVFFAQDEWSPAPAWQLQAGLRVEHLHITTASPSQQAQQCDTAVAPLLHLRHAFDAKGREVLRASLARSQRVPDVGLLMPRYNLNTTYARDEPNTPLAADSAGNPALRPEQVLALELAYEQTLSGNGVASVGLFHRQVDGLIRRRIALETVAEAPVPRWVSRPANVGRARSTGLELEYKGPADAWWPAAKGLRWRAALSLYRSAVEQIDDPDARLEGQPPWSAQLGLDHTFGNPAWRAGASLALVPGFSTQQSDQQRVWRGPQRRLDAYAQWKLDRQTSLRLAVNNALAAVGRNTSRSTSRVEDLDGFAAASATERDGLAQWTATVVARF